MGVINLVKRFEDISGATGDFTLPLLSELKGKTFVIIDVTFKEGNYGEYAIVTTSDKKQYRTSSGVLLDQLHKIEEEIKQEGVEVTLVKNKNYYTFM